MVKYIIERIGAEKREMIEADFAELKDDWWHFSRGGDVFLSIKDALVVADADILLGDTKKEPSAGIIL
jgi:hypothetical protein